MVVTTPQSASKTTHWTTPRTTTKPAPSMKIVARVLTQFWNRFFLSQPNTLYRSVGGGRISVRALKSR